MPSSPQNVHVLILRTWECVVTWQKGCYGWHQGYRHVNGEAIMGYLGGFSLTTWTYSSRRWKQKSQIMKWQKSSQSWEGLNPPVLTLETAEGDHYPHQAGSLLELTTAISWLSVSKERRTSDLQQQGDGFWTQSEWTGNRIFLWASRKNIAFLTLWFLA